MIGTLLLISMLWAGDGSAADNGGEPAAPRSELRSPDVIDAESDGLPPEPPDGLPPEPPEGLPPEPPSSPPPLPTIETPATPPVEPPSATTHRNASQQPEVPAELNEAIEKHGPRKLLELSGVDDSHLRHLVDGETLGLDEQEVLLKLLYRARKFDRLQIAGWTQRDLDFAALTNRPDEFRTQMFALNGRVTKIVIQNPPPEVVDRFQMTEYYASEIALAGGEFRVLVLTPTLPASWPRHGPIDERVSVAAMFVKVGERAAGRPRLVFVAPRLAWHPDRVQSGPNVSEVNFGMTLLGNWGMDVSEFDHVENRKPITAEDREAFYQMLSAVDEVAPAQLLRFARANLQQRAVQWREEEKMLSAMLGAADGKPVTPAANTKEQADAQKQLLMLRQNLVQAEKGLSSVVPLFNAPESQHGQLVVIEGTARRAIKVYVGSDGGGANSDVRRRFGIDHYYELAVFTEDSQDNPLIVCVRELPRGFPAGEGIHEAVRIAGFFFKSWAYHTQQIVQDEAGEIKKRRQLAPLLIGREPTWIRPESTGRNPYVGALIGGLFVLTLFGIWLGLWRYNRGDAEFHQQTISKHYQVDEGTSLDDLGIQSDDKPDFSNLD